MTRRPSRSSRPTRRGCRREARRSTCRSGRRCSEYAGARAQAAAAGAARAGAARRARACAWLAEHGRQRRAVPPAALDARRGASVAGRRAALEAAGVVVRMPGGWRARRPPRPQVHASPSAQAARRARRRRAARLPRRRSRSTASRSPSARSRELLAAQRRAARSCAAAGSRSTASGSRQMLDRLRAVERRRGRRPRPSPRRCGCSPARQIGGDADAPEATSRLVAGGRRAHGWRETLAGLRTPDGAARGSIRAPALRAELRPYQEVGVRWLHCSPSSGSARCLADDMGLGKTIQVHRAAAAARARAASAQAPQPAGRAGVAASPTGSAELARFAPSLRVLVAHPSAMPPTELGGARRRQRSPASTWSSPPTARSRASPWLARDAVGPGRSSTRRRRSRTPARKQTRAVKELQARGAHRADRHAGREPARRSLVDLRLPQPGLLGSAKAFARFVKQLGSDATAATRPLRELVRPYILRRLKTDQRVIADLPDKTEMTRVLRAARRRRPRSTSRRSTSCATQLRERRRHQAARRRPRVADALQADLQPPVAVARRRRLRARATAASSRACASSPRRSPRGRRRCWSSPSSAR